MKNCIILFSSVIFIINEACNLTENNTLLFRHGNRTPDKGAMYPSDIHINETFYPVGYGHLTLKGKRTEYRLGQYIRQNYNVYLGNKLTPEIVYALSTNFKRTKASLLLVLAGMFPLNGPNKIEPNLNWQPIPYIYENGYIHRLYLSKYNCPSYLHLYNNYLFTDSAQEIMNNYTDLYKYLSKHVGYSVRKPLDVLNIYSTLLAEKEWGFKIPPWAEGYFPKILQDAAAVEFEFETGTDYLKKFSAGFLLDKILKDTQLKINGVLNKERKVFLYSAHDTNIAVVLRTLNVWNRHLPPYGAALFFEIHKIEDNYGLKLYYQDYISPNPKLITIPGCSSLCNIIDLHNIIKKYLPMSTDDCFIEKEF